MKLLFLMVPVFLGLTGGVAVAQSSASGVVNVCEDVASSGVSTGACVGATGNFLSGLSGNNDDAVADLVAQLVALAAVDPACTDADDEIARAIRLAATYSPSAALRILALAEGVDCDAGGAPATPGSLSSPGSVGSGGTPVSSAA
jgi:hypothetical protein